MKIETKNNVIEAKSVDWNYVLDHLGVYRESTCHKDSVVINDGIGIVFIGPNNIWALHNGEECQRHCKHWGKSKFHKISVSNIRVEIN